MSIIDNRILIFENLKSFAEELKGLFAYKNELQRETYPVGSIYISVLSTNPAELFGFGTWDQIQDTFLLAAGSNYAAGSTGGEATHRLTVNELPSHDHTATVSSDGAHTHKIGTDKDAYYLYSGECWSIHNASSGADYMNGATSSNGKHSHTVTIGSTGEGAAHNNMPPYWAVYMWVRSA